MKVVVDIGCARYGNDYSIERLVERFKPDLLLGFDPNVEPGWEMQGDTKVVLVKAAVGDYHGTATYHDPGLGGWVSERGEGRVVPMVDILDVVALANGLAGGKFVMKIDAEGAEYSLLDKINYSGADDCLLLAWVEWHPLDREERVQWRAALEQKLRCPVEEWLW